ncbi:hypothetical protein AB0M47_16720 [Hamadaea sp. NPDC051192]|uniref:hypothetical protein n=1 Tax=Hamadaea sp. NPDC051192 TaxID=3154940 RepID=UPI00343B807E
MMVLLATALMAGCSANDDPSPALPQKSASTTAACAPEVAAIKWETPAVVRTLTGATRLTVSANGERSIGVVKQDQPAVTKINGFSDSERWRAWILKEATATLQRPFDVSSGPALAEVDQFLDGMTKTGDYIGFVGVFAVTADFRITCEGQPPLAGSLVGWDSSTSGVLECGRPPAPESFAALASQYC